MNQLFQRIFPRRSQSTLGSRCLSKRRLRIEGLEERQLLTVQVLTFDTGGELDDFTPNLSVSVFLEGPAIASNPTGHVAFPMVILTPPPFKPWMELILSFLR